MCKECETIAIDNLYKNGEEVQLWIRPKQPRRPFKYEVGYITKNNETILQQVFGNVVGLKSKYANKFYIIQCNICGGIYYKSEDNLVKDSGCPICKGLFVYTGINDMWTTRPYLASKLANEQDGYKYAYATNYELQFICDHCGKIINKKPSDLIDNKGIFCNNQCQRDNELIDLTGQRFGRWTVLKLDEDFENKHGFKKWICKCDCGSVRSVFQNVLIAGKSNSCGCLTVETLKARCGEKHPNYTGTTPIISFCRHFVLDWKKECLEYYNYTCDITGQRGGCLHVHHKIGFNTIVRQAHKEHNIAFKDEVCDYTQEEIELIKQYVISKHTVDMAVVLTKKIHEEFHSIYKCGNNTPEQYEEFKERYLNGEFNTEEIDSVNDMA